MDISTLSSAGVPTTLLRNLSDRSYEKRRFAAHEVKNLVSATLLRFQPASALEDVSDNKGQGQHNPEKKLLDLLEVLSVQLACSTESSSRRGGMMGLGAFCMGFVQAEQLRAAEAEQTQSQSRTSASSKTAASSIIQRDHSKSPKRRSSKHTAEEPDTTGKDEEGFAPPVFTRYTSAGSYSSAVELAQAFPRVTDLASLPPMPRPTNCCMLSFYLQSVLPVVLGGCNDADSRVRYSAVEALYNLTKAAGLDVLPYFYVLFTQIVKLFTDVDVDVNNAAKMLNNLLKRIVSMEAGVTVRDLYASAFQSKTPMLPQPLFEPEGFLMQFNQNIGTPSPYVRKLMIDWILALDGIPEYNIVAQLPLFLGGLFSTLSDVNREIRLAADVVIAGFLVKLKKQSSQPIDQQPNFAQLVHILKEQCYSNQKFNRLTAISWIQEMLTMGFQEQLIPLICELLPAVLRCIHDDEDEIREQATIAHNKLLAISTETGNEIDVESIYQVVAGPLYGSFEGWIKDGSSEYIPLAIESLQWLSMLLDKVPNDILHHLKNLSVALLKTVSQLTDEVMLLNLQVMTRIARNQQNVLDLMLDILALFDTERSFLERKGCLVLRKLCELEGAHAVFLAVGKYVSNLSDKDSDLGTMIVQVANLVLLTGIEARDLRSSLKVAFQEDPSHQPASATLEGEQVSDKELFKRLFACWSHSPVAAYSLCLLAEAYELGYCVIKEFAETEQTVGSIMQMDKLLELLESPVYTHVRVALMDTPALICVNELLASYSRYVQPLKTAAGHARPVETAFGVLATRLHCAEELHHVVLVQKEDEDATNPLVSDGLVVVDPCQEELLQQFLAVQKVHHAKAMQRLKMRSGSVS